MPQMMPINWLILFFLFMLFYFIFNIMNYFIFNKKLYIKKYNFNMKFKQMNWKW
nr:ATP synthase F0 subunit 8 [Sarbanissa venusta]